MPLLRAGGISCPCQLLLIFLKVIQSVIDRNFIQVSNHVAWEKPVLIRGRTALYFVLPVSASFSINNVCNKIVFFFLAASFDSVLLFVNVNLSTHSKQNKIQGNAIPLNQRPHAKLLLIWTTFKKVSKTRHRWFMPPALLYGHQKISWKTAPLQNPA